MSTDDTRPLDVDPEKVDQEAELRRLREEVAALKGEGGEAAPPPTAGRTGWWRPVAATVLIVLTAVLAPLSVVANWSHDMVSDTDRYVDTVAPLAKDPQVQTAIARRITNEVVAQIDVDAVTQQAVDALTDKGLNPQLAQSLTLLASPLSDGITNFINTQVTKIVTSDNFQEAWDAANREAHEQLVVVLTGKDSDTVTVDQGAVRVNLAAIINSVKATLVDNGFEIASKIPTVNAQFTILQSADLGKAQTAFRVLNAVARVLPWLALALLAAAVFISRNRRRTLVIGSLAVVASMVLLGVGLNVGRAIYLDALPDDVNPSVAGIVFDQIVTFIREALRAVLVLFLVVAALAWVTGPGKAASGVRSGSNNLLDSIRGKRDDAGIDTGAFGVALWTYRNAIRIGALGLAVLIYVLADHPTAKLTIWLAVLVALVLLVVELLSRPPAEATAADEH